jgi:hypothetical protein
MFKIPFIVFYNTDSITPSNKTEAYYYYDLDKFITDFQNGSERFVFKYDFSLLETYLIKSLQSYRNYKIIWFPPNFDKVMDECIWKKNNLINPFGKYTNYNKKENLLKPF